MGKTGSVANNFHEGSRSEYLAQYVFSAFGTSTPVPHQEDSGIDLFCTLGEVENMRLYVRNYFLAQVKSQESDIRYEGRNSVNWIISHSYPLIICVINKKENHIKVFTTTNLYKNTYDEIDEIVLQLNSFCRETCNRTLKIGIGEPILDFLIENIAEREKVV